jgi:uncharacterized protein YndB with AHSA1/START domain
MWKWIGGCLLVVVALIAAASWWGYQAMQQQMSPDGSTSVTIGASSPRVFASLGNGDSVLTWMAQGNRISTSRHGPLIPGDTLRIEMRRSIGVSPQAMSWVVTRVVPDTLLALELKGGKDNRVLMQRRDSLIAMGDSTRVVSNVVSPLVDGAPATGADGKSSEGNSGFTANLMLSMFRMQAKLELQSLKARIEGKPAPRIRTRIR